jgi:O-antigen/teichoic acid export membrane protein
MRAALIANYAGQGWSAIMNIAFIPVYVHFLGIEAYGLIGAFTIILMLSMLLDAGMTPTLNREMARFVAGEHSPQSIADLLRTVEYLCAGIVAIVWAASLIFAGWLARNWLGANELPPETLRIAVLLMIVTASLRIVEGVYRGALQGLQRPVTMNVWGAVFATLRSGGAALALMLIAPTIETFFIWQASALGISVAIFAIIVHRALPKPDRRPVYSAAAFREVRGFAGAVLVTTILSIFLTQVDKIILVRLLSLEAFGYYALAAAVVGGLYQLVGPVTQSYYPRLTDLFVREDEAGLARTYHQGAQILAVTVAPPAGLMIFFADPLLRIWTGNAEIAHNSAPIMSLLAIGSLLHAMINMPYMLQLSAGWSGFAVRVNLFAVAVLVPAIFYIVPHYGAIGAAGLWVALALCYVLGTAHFMHRRLLRHEKWRWYVHDVLLPAGAALAVAALASVLPVNEMPRLAGLCVLVMVGIASFAAALMTLPMVQVRLGLRL